MAKVLIIGSGGREHALAYRFSRSAQVEQVYVSPGNDGMEDVATIAGIAELDFPGLIAFAKKEGVDLTVVGPETALAAGIVDAFEEAGLCIFGPNRQAAQLEGSKAYAKALMDRAGIQTARFQVFNVLADAVAYCLHHDYPLVIKASGLAAGKGVSIVNDFAAAKQELEAMMSEHKFADAADQVVIEDFLEGEEFSFLCLVNQEVVLPLQIAQDHKRAFDGDQGPNTGGMGAYTPVNSITQEDCDHAMDAIIRPVLAAMRNEGNVFNGVLYAGLMKTAQGIQVIEFNVRFGDPETEVLMVALENDLFQVLMDLKQGIKTTLVWSEDVVIGAVLATKGYPEHYEKGYTIEGLEQLKTPVFHMGTACLDGVWKTNGGRVLFVCAHAEDLKQAQKHLYQEIAKIKCEGLFYRKDIGFHNLKEDL